MKQPEDAPVHVGKPLRRRVARHSTSLNHCEEDRTLRVVLVGMLREAD